MSPEALALALGGKGPKGAVEGGRRDRRGHGGQAHGRADPACAIRWRCRGSRSRSTPAPDGSGLTVTATVRTTGPTGVEMEALTAVSVALLTIYDMLKAVDKAMVIGGVRVIEKHGGRSGSCSA